MLRTSRAMASLAPGMSNALRPRTAPASTSVTTEAAAPAA